MNGRKQNTLSISGLFPSIFNVRSTVGRTLNACNTLPNTRYSSIQKLITTQTNKENKKGEKLIESRGKKENTSFFLVQILSNHFRVEIPV